MRNKVADLLVCALVVAVCFAGAGVFGYLYPDVSIDFMGLSIRMTIFAAALTLMRSGPKNGSYVIRNQEGLQLWPVREYLILVVLLVAFCTGDLYFNGKVGSLDAILGTAGGVAIAATLTRSQKHTSGIAAVVRNEEWRWEDASYDLIDYDGVWRLYPTSGRMGRVAGSILDWPAIPDSEIIEVRTILAAKQEKEGTTDHTDGHG